MTLWSQYISIFKINYHEIKYENLVENLETTLKKLLKFLELPWNDNVLKFSETAKEKKQIKTPSYDQVTQPLYTRSRGRWEKYREQLKTSWKEWEDSVIQKIKSAATTARDKAPVVLSTVVYLINTAA